MKPVIFKKHKGLHGILALPTGLDKDQKFQLLTIRFDSHRKDQFLLHSPALYTQGMIEDTKFYLTI